MATNLSIKNVPEALTAKLRERAKRNRRSLQRELTAILEEALGAPAVLRAGVSGAPYAADTAARAPAGLLDRLDAIARGQGIDTTKRFTREQTHNRKALRKAGI